MNRITLLSLIMLVSSTFLFSQSSGIGVGLMIGEPNGLSGKYWINETNAIDFGIGAGLFGTYNGLNIHADYLYQINDLIKSKYKIPFYYGFGMRFRFSNNSSTAVGVRGVVGLLMFVKKLPIDLFFEIAPSFRLLPTTGLDLDIAIGSRYYFKI